MRMVLTSQATRTWANTASRRSVVLPAARLPRQALRRPCRATGGDSEAGVPRTLTLSEAYAVLGLGEDTSYDDVLATKNRLVERHADDFERRMEVEAAYDLIFSSQLRARLTGDLPVATNVRFADVRRQPPPPPRSPTAAGQKAQQLLGGLPGGGIVVAPPSQKAATTAGVVFGVLATWTLAQGLLEPAPQSAAADVPGLQLALAVAATVYVLREEKRAGLGKAAGLALAGLVAGTFLGAAVQSWLRVDIIPLGGLSSPGALVGEFSLAGLAAVCLFLG